MWLHAQRSYQAAPTRELPNPTRACPRQVYAHLDTVTPPSPSCRGSLQLVAAVSCCLCTEVGFAGLEEALALRSEAPHTRPRVRSCQHSSASPSIHPLPPLWPQQVPIYLGLLQGPPDSPPTSLLSLLLGVRGDF